MLRLTATRTALWGELGGDHRQLPAPASLDALLASDDPLATASAWFAAGVPGDTPVATEIVAPIGSQEVWAAGVTYLRSREARAEESRPSGADVFYDLVYEAERPELFFKAVAHRVVGPGGIVRIRRDSTWNVPEPELTLVLDRRGRIAGYTIGNDMSSRSIEGSNPLYLPQAKVYDGSAALGPCIVLSVEPPAPETAIDMTISRAGATAFEGATTVGRIKRPVAELAEWLFRAATFPTGAFLMTGTGIVPDDEFTLAPGDEVAITIDGVGTLRNQVDVVG